MQILKTTIIYVGENLQSFQGVKLAQNQLCVMKELKAKIQSGSLVARRALSQWNKLNTTIRGIVSAMKVDHLQ